MKKTKKKLSEAQMQQRKNASHSKNNIRTGPKTEEGKKRSSTNAIKHCLFAKSARAQMVGVPCLTTCHKAKTCSFLLNNKTKPGGKCLDVIDWEVAESAAAAIIDAQNGDTEAIFAIQALLVGQGITLVQHLFEDIKTRGLTITQDVFNSDEQKIGTREVDNPSLGLIIKFMDKQGLNLPEAMATPAAIAKASTDDANQETAAEFVRNQTKKLFPGSMSMPQFNDDEVIIEADIVEDKGE